MSGFTPGKRWVVKVGSSSVTDGGKGLATERLSDWVRQIAELRGQGLEVALVSSGAVAEGMTRLGLAKRPQALDGLQAAAAVGQMGLVQAYEAAFQRYATHTAQVLLTHADLRDRARYLNARSSLRRLLALGVVPVINENDTVATDEFRFGDNDTLAALVANLLEADTLVILTDQAGLYSARPGSPDAELVRQAPADDPRLDGMAGAGSATGRGGMVTKVAAARIAARSGASTVICSGQAPDVLLDIIQGKAPGTLLTAGQGRMLARKRWLASLPVQGRLRLDAGACKVLSKGGKSLLAVGVEAVEGDFGRGEMVACLDSQGREVARGLANYSAEEVARLRGKPSSKIEALLGYVAEEELIHRDNMLSQPAP